MRLLSETQRRTIGLLLVGGFGIFAAMQLIRPRLENPPVDADLQAPEQVKQILRTSCYNCHSNETKLAWFDQVVPGYWLVVHDVREARQHMNFSDFGKLPAAQQKAFLYEAVNMVQLGAMPLPQYKLVHPEAAVTPEQLATLKNYLHPADDHAAADPAQVAAADGQYQAWIAGTNAAPTPVRPVLNGMAFPSDYKNWRPVSTTDRFDNHTMRVILGNDVAVRAIAENQIRPWPDGTAFAKIAWKQQSDGQGRLATGEFLQVEFMVKDASKYASTEGWQFGRWRGTDLAPYGKDANFAVECTSCHAPVRENDFVYTLPITDRPLDPKFFNREATLPADLPYRPLQWRILTTSVDRQNETMSTLYGNDLAVTHARTGPQGAYPPGAVLALITWKQRDDPHWFGARIAGQVRSVEFVVANPDETDQPSYSYEAYSGSPLQKSSPSAAAQSRIDAIIGLRAAVEP